MTKKREEWESFFNGLIFFNWENETVELFKYWVNIKLSQHFEQSFQQVLLSFSSFLLSFLKWILALPSLESVQLHASEVGRSFSFVVQLFW